MTVSSTKNQIQEVLDQISLDYAAGKYLNVVSSNLGLDRPLFGFSDAAWRAITRIVALRFRQIPNKFRDVLEILVGPQTTRVASLSEDSAIGSKQITVHDTTELPDVGTIVFDEGLTTEETVEYCLVDRTQNIVYLNSNTSFARSAVPGDAKTILLYGKAGSTEVLVSSAESFPTSGFPYTLVLGRGTDTEEVVQLQGVDIDTHTLTTSALAKDHLLPELNLVSTTLSSAYAAGSFFLQVNDVSFFPDSGTLILEDSATIFTATGGTTTSITVAASTFSRTNGLSTYKVAFSGNITPALKDQEVYIKGNTDSTITLFSSITAPSAGDTFTIRPIIEFTGIDRENNTINLKDSLAFELASGVGTQVEVLKEEPTAVLAPVKINAIPWDLYDNGDGLFEVYVPETERDRLRLLDASFAHAEATSSPPSTTTVAPTNITTDPARLFVASTIGWPSSGVAILPGENVGYVLSEPTFLTAEVKAGGTTLTVSDVSVLPAPGGTIDIDVNGGSPETVVVVTRDLQTNTVTVFPSLVSDHLVGSVIREAAFEIPHGFETVTPTSSTVSLYEPVYPSTSVIDGGGITTQDVFEGPYLYQETAEGPAVSTSTVLKQTLAGPTRLAISVDVTSGEKTAIEVEDGTTFPLTSTFSMMVGQEKMTATEVSLKQRCVATLASAYSPGSTTLSASNLRPGLYTASDFPLAKGYRVVLSPFTFLEEVVFVKEVVGNTLILDSPTTTSHGLGDEIRLYSDTVTVTQIDTNHVGINDYSDRSVSSIGTNRARPSTINDDSLVERVTPLYSSILVADTTNYPSTGGTVFISKGIQNRVLRAYSLTINPGDTLITGLTNPGTAHFPTDTPYWIIIDEGTAFEERMEVTFHDVAFRRFTTFAFGPEPGEARFSHPYGTPITLRVGSEEKLEYSSISGNTIVFPTEIMLQSTHQAGETVVLSSGPSTPSLYGTDFPLKMPSDLFNRIRFVFDLIRAAGVQVVFISKR